MIRELNKEETNFVSGGMEHMVVWGVVQKDGTISIAGNSQGARQLRQYFSNSAMQSFIEACKKSEGTPKIQLDHGKTATIDITTGVEANIPGTKVPVKVKVPVATVTTNDRGGSTLTCEF